MLCAARAAAQTLKSMLGIAYQGCEYKAYMLRRL
jgi:hypothetical protein